MIELKINGLGGRAMGSGEDTALNVPNVVGGDELVAKQSAVNEQGKLRLAPIEGVIFRPTRPVPHEDGHVTEVGVRAGES